MRKTIDLKEYIVKISYKEENSELKIEVFDAGGESIDYLFISDDDDEEGEEEQFNLN